MKIDDTSVLKSAGDNRHLQETDISRKPVTPRGCRTDFVHLHVHTDYSLLDSTIRIEALIKKTKEYGMPAVVITDNGNLFGIIEFYKEAKKYDVKPIIGCELYVAPKCRFGKDSYTTAETSKPIIVLAENKAGYKNLLKLSSAGYLEGFKKRPHIHKELLAHYHQGLIGISGGLDGEIANLIIMDKKDDARNVISEYKTIFGDGSFFLELVENSLPDQQKVNKSLIEFAKELRIPLVATNNCHYLNMEDAEAHEVLHCIQTGRTIADTKVTKYKTDQFYFRPPEEMCRIFAYCPEAVRNTIAIAKRCNVEFKFDEVFLPKFVHTQNDILDERLARDAAAGLQKLLPVILKGTADPALVQRYRQRLSEELEIIKSKGVASYFLIVADYVQYAKGKNILVGPGRGSSTGSLVLYALGITNIDPIYHGLIFEKFLNPLRNNLPYIDINFCLEGRKKIFRYLVSKYGKDKVARIITFSKMSAKAAIRDVGRALNVPYEEVDAIVEMVPNVLNITIEEAIEMEPHLQEEEKNNPKIKKLLTLARSLEGLNIRTSKHAAGIVISDTPLVDRVPLYKKPKDDIVTQFSMNNLWDVGLVTFDLLGLKALTVIRDAVKFIEEGKGISLDIKNIPLNDKPTYQLLSSGDTDGVFQLRGPIMKDIVISIKPDCIEDIAALTALYRPGSAIILFYELIARKQGKTKITYAVSEFKGILKDTCGLIIYQEQVIQIASIIGKFTMAEADGIRWVINLKMPDEIEKVRVIFLQGAVGNKIPEHKAQKIWDQIAVFAQYGYNRAHRIAYAMISYQMAFLKTNYPVEFGAALIRSAIRYAHGKSRKYIRDCEEAGISVLPIDINESYRHITVSGNNIRTGLATLVNDGNFVQTIISEREKGGKFNSFFDFCSRMDLNKVNKHAIKDLIKQGAFDSLVKNRQQLMGNYERIIDEYSDKINLLISIPRERMKN